MSSMKIIAGLVAAVAATTWVVQSRHSSSTSSATVDRSDASPRTPVASGQSTPPLGSGRLQAQSALSPSGRLAQEATRSKNLREFVERAKQRPTEGGIAYAVAAMHYCQYFMQMSANYSSLAAEVGRSQDGGTAARRLAALNQLTAQCRDFTVAELGQAMSLRASGKWSDPILQLQGRWFEYSRLTDDQRVELVSATLAAKDPYLLHWLGPRIGQQQHNGETIVYFNNQRFGGLETAADWWAAWSLVPCQFGEDCSASSDLTQLCVFDATCYPDRQALVRSKFAGREAEFNKVLTVAASLSDAVERGEARRFFKSPTRH